MSHASTAIAERLVQEVIRLFPRYAADPVDAKMSEGNAAVCVIGPAGELAGHIFGTNKERGARCFGIAMRKVTQVWRTGYATGRFEELVYGGKLNEATFGISRPDFIGWLGGVPLISENGEPVSAAFSGFRGQIDVEIIEKAVEAVAGLRVKRD